MLNKIPELAEAFGTGVANHTGDSEWYRLVEPPLEVGAFMVTEAQGGLFLFSATAFPFASALAFPYFQCLCKR